MRQTTRPTLEGTFGMVGHALAGVLFCDGGTGTRRERLRCRGDRGFVEHVVEPNENSPGGDANIIFATAQDAQPRVLCGQGPAPAGATIEHYTGVGLDVVPGTGSLAAAIPGAVPAWLRLLHDYGTMRLREVIEPAIGYAQHGHPIIADISARSPRCRRCSGPSGPPPPSSTSVAVAAAAGGDASQSRPRATWIRLLDEAESAGSDREAQIEKARKVWSEGFIAEQIEEFAKTEVMDSSGQRHRGVLTAADLAGWNAGYESALTFTYGDWTVAKSRPWGQSPVFLQQLALLPIRANWNTAART